MSCAAESLRIVDAFFAGDEDHDEKLSAKELLDFFGPKRHTLGDAPVRFPRACGGVDRRAVVLLRVAWPPLVLICFSELLLASHALSWFVVCHSRLGWLKCVSGRKPAMNVAC